MTREEKIARSNAITKEEWRECAESLNLLIRRQFNYLASKDRAGYKLSSEESQWMGDVMEETLDPESPLWRVYPLPQD